MPVIHPERRYDTGAARMLEVAKIPPLGGQPLICLFAVDLGRAPAPAVISAMLGARSEVLERSVRNASQRLEARYADRPGRLKRQKEALERRVASGALERELMNATLETPKALFEAAARHVFRTRGIPVDHEHPEREMVVCPGTSLAIHEAALRRVLKAGKKLIVPSPYFGPFSKIGEKAKLDVGGLMITVPTEGTGHRLLADSVAAVIRDEGRDRIGALLFTYPNNSSFQIQDTSELQGLADLIVDQKLRTLCDELYAELHRPGQEHVSLASMHASERFGGKPLYPLILTTTGTSKLCNLIDPMLRSGVACSGDREWIDEIRASLKDAGKLVTRRAAIASEAAYTHTDEQYRIESRALMADASKRIERQVRHINLGLGMEAVRFVVRPQAAYYECITLAPELLEHHGIGTSDQLCEYVHLTTGVFAQPLTMLGTDEVGLRINAFGNIELADPVVQERQVSAAFERIGDLARQMKDGRAPTYAQVMKRARESLGNRELESLSMPGSVLALLALVDGLFGEEPP